MPRRNGFKQSVARKTAAAMRFITDPIDEAVLAACGENDGR